MTVMKPDRSRTLVSLERPLLVSLSIHVILGYSLYVVALMQAEPPVWAIDCIEQLKPTLQALETAARLSDRPFPAQVMILYAVISSVLLTMYWVYYIFFVEHVRQEMYRRYCEWLQQTRLSIKKRLYLAVCGAGALFAVGYHVPVHYFLEGGMKEGVVMDSGRLIWRVTTLFSPSILSATLLLVLSVVTAFWLVGGPVSLYMLFASFKPSTQTRS